MAENALLRDISVRVSSSSVPAATTTPKAIFHYTSLAGFQGIVETESLRVSSILYLNDAAEWLYALKLTQEKLLPVFMSKGAESEKYWNEMQDWLAKMKLQDCLVGSFSEEPDQLSQWRAYCNGGFGFSIGFDVDLLRKEAVRQKFELHPCIYDPKSHSETIEGLIRNATQLLQQGDAQGAIGYSVVNLLRLAPMLKDPSFKEEKEWRLIGELKSFDAPVKLRAGKSLLIPYDDFRFMNPESPPPISKVIVGPTPHMDLSIRSAQKLLSTQGIKGVSVEPSAVPYRNW